MSWNLNHDVDNDDEIVVLKTNPETDHNENEEPNCHVENETTNKAENKKRGWFSKLSFRKKSNKKKENKEDKSSPEPNSPATSENGKKSSIPEPNPEITKEEQVPKFEFNELEKENQPSCPPLSEVSSLQQEHDAIKHTEGTMEENFVDAPNSFKIWKPNGQLNFSVACYPPEKLIPKFKITDELSSLNVPCPKCQGADCFWHCYKCTAPLKVESQKIVLFCECGGTPITEFAFKCKHKDHGNEFVKFEDGKLRALLGITKSFGSKNILIIGESGVGKSTFINAVANYLSNETLEDAEEGDPINLIPTSFKISDANGQMKAVIVGKETKDESLKQSQSATRFPKVHQMKYKGGYLNFIDTPGMNDTRGVKQDEDHNRRDRQEP